jgi:hypothetical protein
MNLGGDTMHQPQIAHGPPVAQPQGWRTFRHFAYVDRPFRDVRRWIAASPHRILAAPAGSTGDGPPAVSELRVRRAGLDLTRDVRMVVGDIQIGIHSARLPLRWEDAARPGFFPVVDATLEVAPVRAGRHAMTQLGLFGQYRPPFGRLGALADSLAGQRIVLESIERFLDDLVDRFQADLPEPEPAPEDGGAGTGASEHAGWHRIVLPVEALDRRPGGAAALAQQFLDEPGVVDASVNPASGLAVIDYDATACSVGRLLSRVEIEE